MRSMNFSTSLVFALHGSILVRKKSQEPIETVLRTLVTSMEAILYKHLEYNTVQYKIGRAITRKGLR